MASEKRPRYEARTDGVKSAILNQYGEVVRESDKVGSYQDMSRVAAAMNSCIGEFVMGTAPHVQRLIRAYDNILSPEPTDREQTLEFVLPCGTVVKVFPPKTPMES